MIFLENESRLVFWKFDQKFTIEKYFEQACPRGYLLPSSHLSISTTKKDLFGSPSQSRMTCFLQTTRNCCRNDKCWQPTPGKTVRIQNIACGKRLGEITKKKENAFPRLSQVSTPRKAVAKSKMLGHCRRGGTLVVRTPSCRKISDCGASKIEIF